MIIRSTSLLGSGIALLTLGESCHYVVAADSAPLKSATNQRFSAGTPFVLAHIGTSAHAHYLLQRFAQIGLRHTDLQFLLIGSVHALELGGLWLLREMNPQLKTVAPQTIAEGLKDPTVHRALFESDQQLSRMAKGIPLPSFETFRSALKIDERLGDQEPLQVSDECTIRAVATPGAYEIAYSYFTTPSRFLIADSVCGYFRGRELASPAADFSLGSSIASIAITQDLEPHILGLRWSAALRGEHAQSHLHSITQNSADLIREAKAAHDRGVSAAHVRESVRRAFYTSASPDPFYQFALAKTSDALQLQLIG